MDNVYVLAFEHPELWQAAGQDVEAFLSQLFDLAYITQDHYEWLMGQPYDPAVLEQTPPVDVTERPAEANVYQLMLMYPDIWAGSDDDIITFCDLLASRGVITWEQRDVMIAAPSVPVQVKVPAEVAEEVTKAQISDAIFETQKGYFATAVREVLVSLWQWMVEKLKDLIDLVIGTLRPALEAAWEFARSKFEEYGRTLYDGAMKLFEGHSPITPEDAPALALKLYLFAMGAGMAAHGTAAVTELLHPLKRVGLHQTAAAIGDFAGFGRISAATMGTLVNRVLAQSMTYACQDRYRPVIPREQLLIEFRSKREIDRDEFGKAMAYQGFSDYWTNIIERWQWKDPRMFEIIRFADIGLEQGPPPSEELPWLQRFGVTGSRLKDWWLWRKFMRAGYEDCDIPVMVRFIHRREVSFALTYVRTAIRRNYRWGYLSDEELDKWMDRLQLPDQAKEWIFWAGELDREYFYRQDLQNYYVTAFRNDLIDSDELLVSLLAMNLPPREASLLMRTEKIRKKPKAQAAVPAAEKAAATKIQSSYISLYREQYKKGLIDEQLYLESLLAIGLDPELAEVTVELDATKRVPALPV